MHTYIISYLNRSHWRQVAKVTARSAAEAISQVATALVDIEVADGDSLQIVARRED